MEERIPGGQVFLAVCAYVPPLFVIPLIPQLMRRPAARFVVFHTRQGLYLFAVAIVLLFSIGAVFYLARKYLEVALIEQILAVLVVMGAIAYLLIVFAMVLAVLRRRYAMIPVLGEFAGER